MVNQSQQTIAGLIKVPKSEAILLLESGYFLLQMRNFKDAYLIFNGVADLLPHSDVPRIALGNLMFAQNKIPGALKEFKKAVAISPKSALSWAHIGECLFFEGKFDEGIEALNKAVKLEPKGMAGKFAQELLQMQKNKFFDKKKAKSK